MMRKILLLAVALVFAILLASGSLVPQTAQADLPGGAGCPAAPGAGVAKRQVSATLPAAAPQNANGVCINLTGTGGANNSATLVANAQGCQGVAVPTVGAGSSYVWADWGSNNCVAPGDRVIVRFKSSGSDLQVAAVTWSLQGGGTIDGTAEGDMVGGVVERPDEGGLPSESGSSDGSSFPWYAALAVAAVLAVSGVAAGSYVIRRRSLQ